MAEQLKLFILGPARSGTSIMYFAAREVFGLTGKGESHVIPIFDRVIRVFQNSAAKFKDMTVMASKLEPEPFRSLMVEHLRKFYRHVYDADTWVDKTPGRVVGVPLILKAFPDARVIITRRTGVETVMSHLIKFNSGFEQACRLWTQSMQDIVALRKKPAAITSHILEQDQFDLTNAADESAARIAAHLGRPEKAGDLAAYFRERRVQKSSAHEWDRRITMAETTWTDKQKASFARECGKMMETLGYPM
jgi:hypothetical protein